MLHLWYCSVKKVQATTENGGIGEIKQEKIVEKVEVSQEVSQEEGKER